MPKPFEKNTTPGLFKRIASVFYDSLLVIALDFSIYGIWVLIHGKEVESSWFSSAILLIATFGFFCTFWLRGGQTLGMRAWKLKLVTTSGEKLSFRHCLIRLLFAFGGLSHLSYWFLGAGLHEKISGTQLVLTKAELTQL